MYNCGAVSKNFRINYSFFTFLKKQTGWRWTAINDSLQPAAKQRYSALSALQCHVRLVNHFTPGEPGGLQIAIVDHRGA